MFKQNKLQIFSFRKVKGYGLASAVIASMFLAQGIVSADVVTTPDGTKTTLSNDKASVTVDANHFKDSNDKSAKELYDAKEYEADKVTTGKDTVSDESKTVVSYETKDGTKLKEDVTKTATEEKELNYKIEGSSGKEYTGTSTPTSNVNADLEKQDTIEKDGEKYKYVRTETTQGNETVLTDTHFNDVETKASVEGMYNNDGSIKYDKIKDGSRVWVLEEKEDGTYGKYALIENAQGLSDEKIQEAAKTATKKFSKAEVEKLGGIKDTDSIVVYETNTYAARKQTSEHFGKDFYYNNTANESLFRKDTIDKIFEAGLEGLEKRGDSYFYKGVEVPTIENFKTIPMPDPDNDNKIITYDTDTTNKYYTTEPEGYTVPTTYYNVINDFFIKNPESEIFKNKANDVFWGTNDISNSEELYAKIAFVTDILNKSLKDKYNIDTDTQDFKNKRLESKSNNDRPVFDKKYSFKKTNLHDNVKSWEETFDSLLDKELWIREISTSYSIENVKKVRNLIKAYQNLDGGPTSDVFNNKNDSDVTINEYAEAIYNNITSAYIETYKDQFTEEGSKVIKNKFGNSPILKIGDRVGYGLDSSQKDMTVQAASELYRNSPGIITENTETFTYHDVITPLRAYRLTADNNIVRHVYEQVKRGSVVATYSDEDGNKLADDVNVKTNEYEGEDYQTEAKQIRPIYNYETVNGLTKTTTTTYELIKTPDNANGKVVAETTTVVPYVYRKVVTVDIKGSVIATYKDEEGNILASEEKVITNQNAGTYYAAASKPIQASTSSQETEHGRKVTVITYELIKTPDNETGEVVGGETLVVPYVYRKVVTVKSDGGVVATHKDTEGNDLAPKEVIKSHAPNGEAYTTSAKEIPSKVVTDKTPDGFTRTTTTTYTLVENPTNKDGNVVGGDTITVPYVYKPTTDIRINGSVIATYTTEDGEKLADNESVKTDAPEQEAYTTTAKEFESKTETSDVNGLTKTTVTRYELIKEPENKDGNVVGNQTITVPYVYRKVVTETINGSVIATHKDTEGNELAPQETVKTNEPSGTAYTTSSKEIPEKVEIDQTVKGLTRVTTTRYELVENPSNKDGNVVGGETTTVPYVYKPIKTVQINGSVIATYKTEDGEKLADDVAVKTDAPSGEAYTTERKTFDNVTKEEDVNGFTRLTTTRYELIETPANADGNVEADQITYVPYVYRKVVTVSLDGSVVATHKDTEGNELSPQETIKSHTPDGDAYTTNAKSFDPVVTIDTVDGLTRTTTTTYELVETPTNANGNVKGGETITVPYVYKKVVKQDINGSVIVTHHDENGVQLALDEKIKDNVKAGEPYTTSPKQFDSSITTNHVNGLTQTTYAHYELSRIPSNDTGEVIGGETTIVPYIYRRVERIVTNGSVVATYKDTEGNELAPQVNVKTDVEPGQAYDTEVKTFVTESISESKPTDDVVKVTVTEYRLVKTPENKSGEVKDGQTIVVPYVYEKVVSVHYEKKDKPKHEFEIPKDAPKVEKNELKLTRFILEDRKTEIKDMVDGFVKPIQTIGNYTYTGITDSDEGGAVITHIYKLVEPEVPNVSELPKDSPVHDKPEFNGGVIPNDAPIHDKPEYKGGVVPNDAPVHDKPEFNGGVVPNDPPVHDKPEYNGGVVPNDSPVHDKPKLDIPTPEVPTPTPELPKPETPSVEIPKPSQPLEQKPQEKYVTKELPNTGGSESSALGLLGFAGVMGSLLLLKKQKED